MIYVNTNNSERSGGASDDRIIRYIDRLKEETDFKIEMLNKKIQKLRADVSQLKGGSE